MPRYFQVSPEWLKACGRDPADFTFEIVREDEVQLSYQRAVTYYDLLDPVPGDPRHVWTVAGYRGAVVEEPAEAPVSWGAFEGAAEAARAHPGGALYRWHRLMGLNAYTIGPRKPQADAADLEKDRLRERAVELAAALIFRDVCYAGSVRKFYPEFLPA